MSADATQIIAALSNENFDLRRQIAELEIRLGIRVPERRESFMPDGITMSFDEKLEMQIMTPHEGERAGDPPLWLIWWLDIDADCLGWPMLRGIGTTERDARILTGMALDQIRRSRELKYQGGCLESGVFSHVARVEVERTAGNHFYGSKMLMAANSKVVFENKPIVIRSYDPKRGYRHEGD